MKSEDVSKLDVDICANNGGFYCEFLNATDKFCTKHEQQLCFEGEKTIGLSFIKKCQECLEKVQEDKAEPTHSIWQRTPYSFFVTCSEVEHRVELGAFPKFCPSCGGKI